MKNQNAPLWRNGQIPSSNSSNESGETQNDALREAQRQNQQSEKNKRTH